MKYIVPALLFAAMLAALYAFLDRPSPLPAGIVSSNGRIEATTIDIASRSGGRVLTVPVEEGDMVQAGQVVATLDLNNVAASLAGAEANVRNVRQQKEQAGSLVQMAEAEAAFSRKEYERTSSMVGGGGVSRSQNDEALSKKEMAEAAVAAARQHLAGVAESEATAAAEVDRLKDLLGDRELKASKTARVLYRLSEPGEVVAAGGRVVTLLDLSDVYMTLFLPAPDVARMKMGTEARVVLDALPGVVIPAHVSYISPQAQFTPRQVETKTEREKLTFRIKVRIPKALLDKHLEAVKTGIPGMAYIREDEKVAWPQWLQVDPQLAHEAQGE